MIFWIYLWKVLFIVSVSVFGGMAVWVTIGGYRDIKRLLRTVAQSHQQEQERPRNDG